MAGFRRALTRTLKKYAEDNKMLEKAKVEISGDDFREGLTAVISIKVAEPQFEGQTKTKLGNNEVMGAVDQAVGEALSYYLEEHPKESKMIVDKVILAAQHVWLHARHASPYNASLRCRAAACRANWPTAPARTPKNVNYSSSRVTPPAVLPNKDVTVLSKPSSRSAVRF